MAKVVLLDSGPLVAALWERDAAHQWAIRHFQLHVDPFVTCDAVLSESFFLLAGAAGGKERLCGMLDRRLIVSQFAANREMAELTRLMRRYADTPMSFADACLVRLSELHTDSIVLTLDSDFLVYRRHGRQRIPTLMPR